MLLLTGFQLGSVPYSMCHRLTSFETLTENVKFMKKMHPLPTLEENIKVFRQMYILLYLPC